jgi:3-oxoacyl-[acyl-carrier-protein] synthase II
MGLISALGTLEASWQRLLAAESGIQIYQPFPELTPQPLTLITQTPAQLPRLTQQVVLLALQDAGLVPPLQDCGVVVGSSRGCQGIWEQLARDQELLKEINWIDTLPNQGAIATARQIGTTAPVFSPTAACATGTWAIAQGFELIQTGRCQRVLAGAVEAPITSLTLAGFHQMRALAKSGAYPFDQYRQGFVLGEGGAILVLESAELAQQRGAKIYGQVLGFGLTSDAYHATAPAPKSLSAIAAVKQCLDRSRLSPRDINYIHAHGTATQLNDQNEAYLIEKLFSQGVPVSSTKGATGHTLGASGALGAAFSLLALKHQTLPPCVGLNSPAFNLDFVTSPRQAKVQQVLCFSFGFGGQNGAIAFGMWPGF